MLDRQDFFDLMSTAVAQGASAEPTSALMAPGKAKTRVLEAHPAEDSLDGAGFLLTEAVANKGLTVEPLGDELWHLKGRDFAAFVDTLNPRFWQLHSTSPAEDVRRLVKQMVFERPELDTAWLPSSMLRQLQGEHLYFKSEFEADALLGDAVTARRWRARFEGDAPEGLLEMLRSDDRYGAAATVTGVGSVVKAPGVGWARLVADYRGEFVTGSGSFSVSASAIWNMVQLYEQWVRGLEERHRLVTDVVEGQGWRVEGDVATLTFGREIQNVGRLVEGLFTAKAPFRLWAVPRDMGNDEWYADAVDLHVGHPLRLHVNSTRIRVVLTANTCGNTLARLLTNLQQHLDARTNLSVAA